jgi:hypothetical protein
VLCDVDLEVIGYHSLITLHRINSNRVRKTACPATMARKRMSSMLLVGTSNKPGTSDVVSRKTSSVASRPYKTLPWGDSYCSPTAMDNCNIFAVITAHDQRSSRQCPGMNWSTTRGGSAKQLEVWPWSLRLTVGRRVISARDLPGLGYKTQVCPLAGSGMPIWSSWRASSVPLTVSPQLYVQYLTCMEE